MKQDEKVEAEGKEEKEEPPKKENHKKKKWKDNPEHMLKLKYQYTNK